MSGFRLPGVVGGADSGFDDDTRFECGICWLIYDPATGDGVAQIPPGVPFTQLPDSWRCPQCDNDRSVFLPERRGVVAPPDHNPGPAVVAAFLAAEQAMRDLPVYNPALRVEAVGFQPWQDVWIGILVTPWCMNALLLPSDDRWDPLMPGAVKQIWALPSGEYEFELARSDRLGSFQSLSLFSPMADFVDQATAAETARLILDGLLTVPEPAPPPAKSPAAETLPSRRDLLRGKFS